MEIHGSTVASSIHPKAKMPFMSQKKCSPQTAQLVKLYSPLSAHVPKSAHLKVLTP